MADDARRRRRGRILYSILGLLFAVGVVPLVWTSYRLSTRSRQSIESNQKEWQLDKARLISTQVAIYVDSLRTQVAAIARTLEVDAGAYDLRPPAGADPGGAGARALPQTRTSLVYMAVARPHGQGRPVGAGPPGRREAPGAAQRGLPARAARHADDLHPRRLRVPRGAGGRARASRSRSGRPVEGVVLAVASLQPIREITHRATGGGIFEVYVVDNRGRLIAHSDPSRPLAEDLSGVEIVRLFLEQSVQAAVRGRRRGRRPRSGVYGTTPSR